MKHMCLCGWNANPLSMVSTAVNRNSHSGYVSNLASKDPFACEADGEHWVLGMNPMVRRAPTQAPNNIFYTEVARDSILLLLLHHTTSHSSNGKFDSAHFNMYSIWTYLRGHGITSPIILCPTIFTWTYILYVHHYDPWTALQSVLSQFDDSAQQAYWLIPFTCSAPYYIHKYEKAGRHFVADVPFWLSVFIAMCLRCHEAISLALEWRALSDMNMPILSFRRVIGSLDWLILFSAMSRRGWGTKVRHSRTLEKFCITNNY